MYSLHYNDQRQCWIAKCKKPDGNWTTKFLPKKLERRHEIEAEQWFIQWYGGFLGKTPVNQPISETKTIALLANKWLKFRLDDSTGTKMNTYKGLKSSMENWILDNPKFKHYSIQNIDLEKDFTVNVTRSWINSLQGEYATRIQQINTLRAFFRDCIGNEWLDGEMTSPLEKLPIKKMIKELSAAKSRETQTAQFTYQQIKALLATPHKKVKDWRKVRYLLAITTGMRDAEIQGLVWSDVHLDEQYITVERQLDKIGHTPFKRYEDLVLQGHSKEEIGKIPNALVSDPKYHSNRLIPLHPLTVAALKYWKEKGWRLEVGRKSTDADPVLPRNKVSLRAGAQAGDFTMANDGADTLRIDLKRLGLPETENDVSFTFHSFRRTWMTFLDAGGVSEERIGALAGHKGKTVARRNYIRTHLAAFAQDIATLQLDKLALSAVMLSVNL